MDPSEPDTEPIIQQPVFGADKNPNSHIQPAPPLRNNGGGLPGEQKDPRFC